VAALQQFLAEDPSLYPEGTVSGYFGALTEAAVQRFQARYGIVSSGSAATTGYGAIGPKTRAKMNSLQYF
jgi:peptidoglycan hydrolase-like protein with peptidoglycan-binding domain